MDLMSGKPYNQIKAEFTQEVKDGIEQQLGFYNRRINEIQGEQFGYFSGKERQRATWREAFSMLMEDMLADGEAAKVNIGIDYDELRRLIEEKSDALDEVTESVLISWDLWDGNVLVQDKQITGIIDFERSLWGDPLMEHYFSHFNYTPGFIKGMAGQLLRKMSISAEVCTICILIWRCALNVTTASTMIRNISSQRFVIWRKA